MVGELEKQEYEGVEEEGHSVVSPTPLLTYRDRSLCVCVSPTTRYTMDSILETQQKKNKNKKNQQWSFGWKKKYFPEKFNANNNGCPLSAANVEVVQGISVVTAES